MMLNLTHTNIHEHSAHSTSEQTSSMVAEIHEEKENIPLCHYCRKSFANYSNLRHHIQIVHLKESKWDCIKCGKICSSKSNLKVHFRTHIRVKPYTCKYCDYDCMHHSSIKDHLTKNHPDKPHSSVEPGYNYNSQAVPEPDEFNAIDFDPAKFVEQQTHSKPRPSIVPDSNDTVKSTATPKSKPKRFRSDTNILPSTENSSPTALPFLPSTPFPLWPFNLYHPSYFPAMINALRLSNMSHPPTPNINADSTPSPSISNTTQRKSSFEIEGILNLSLRDKKRKNLSDEAFSSDEEESL